MLATMPARNFVLGLLFGSLASVASQNSATFPSSFPHQYPGQPSGDFSPEWQNYFQVKDALPNITFELPRTFTGNIPVQRDGHPNNTLFFMGFEKSNGSLTAAAGELSDEPWGLWLNGGPGTSSLYGLFFENGPIQIGNDFSASGNNFSWNTIADYFWIDQPVGVGFSTVDQDGYIVDEDQMATDFMGFLANLVKVFPSLATRPLHITGESYAGVYIPYIMKAYFEMQNPPVKIAKFAIGDGAMPSVSVYEFVPTVSVIETFPQVINYDPEVYQYFKTQSHLCGYDVNLTYPQNGILPSIPLIEPTSRQASLLYSNKLTAKSFMKELRLAAPRALERRDRELGMELWKRDLSGRPNNTIDPWYGCFSLFMLADYAVNFTFPWNLSATSPEPGFDVYDITDALSPEINQDASIFLNDNRTRTALHAPTSKDWVMSAAQVYSNSDDDDPSPEPMVFFSQLATNASFKNIPVVIYSGNNDALVAHRSSEVTIQNTTFGGIQGFTRRPSTPWTADDGTFAGIVHQERNWTYVLFNNAGHQVPGFQPAAAFTFLREFVFGSNTTGLVTNSSGSLSVVGGENSTLAEPILPGGDAIFYGSGTTQSSYIAPSATRAAWDSFIQTATASSTGGSSSATTKSSGVALRIQRSLLLTTVAVGMFTLR